MANVTNLSNGSKGSEVKKLQEALINAGYDVGKTGADGVLGKNTEAAIKQYQKDNGLTVDGIAGKNTQASLYGTNNNKGNAGGNTNNGGGKTVDPVQPAAPTAPTEEPVADKPLLYGNFTEEEIAEQKNLINEANNVLSQAMGRNPGAFNWGADADYGMANDYLSQYKNRDPFSYDVNSDALYNMYKDQYIQQGQLAMMDTMGQAAAMTGGYGNSYAQSVGQQTYNQYLGKLNEVVPELYGMAYDQYRQEGQDMLNMYDIYMGRANDSYNRHMDSVDLWKNEVAMARDNYTTLLNEYTSAYDQNYKEKQDTREWEYKLEQDAKTEKANNYSTLYSKITSFGYEPSKEEMDDAGMTEKEVKALQDAYTASLNQPKAVEYKEMDYKTGNQWQKDAEKQTSWSGLMSVWDRMKYAKHDPLEAAELIKSATSNSNVKPNWNDLNTLADKMQAAGVPMDQVGAFFDAWAEELGLVDEKKAADGTIVTRIPSTGGGPSGKYVAMPW